MYKRDKKCGPIVADDNLDMTFVTKDFTLDPIPLYLEYSFVYCILVLTRNIMSNILIYRESYLLDSIQLLVLTLNVSDWHI